MRRLNTSTFHMGYTRYAAVLLSLSTGLALTGCFGSSQSTQAPTQLTQPVATHHPSAPSHQPAQPRPDTSADRRTPTTADPELSRIESMTNKIYGDADPAYQPDTYGRSDNEITRTVWEGQDTGPSRQPKPQVVPPRHTADTTTRRQPAPQPERQPVSTEPGTTKAPDSQKVVWEDEYVERGTPSKTQGTTTKTEQPDQSAPHLTQADHGFTVVSPSHTSADTRSSKPSSDHKTSDPEHLKRLVSRVMASSRDGVAYRFTASELAPLSKEDRAWVLKIARLSAPQDTKQQPKVIDQDPTLTKEELREIYKAELEREKMREQARLEAQKELEAEKLAQEAQKEERLRGTLPRNNFQIDKMKLCLEVNGFGKYEEVPANYFIAGKNNPVIIYNEISNFKSVFDQKDKQYYTFLRQEVMLLDAETGAVIWNEKPARIKDASANKRKDFFIIRMVTLTRDLPAGEYMLKVRMIDERLEETDAITYSIHITDPRVVDNTRRE